MKWMFTFLLSLILFSNGVDSEEEEGHFSPQPGGKSVTFLT